jgi:hypothetical protein
MKDVFDKGDVCGWRATIAPLAARLRVAAAFPGLSASWNSTGSRAFLEILESMAWKLDVAAPRRIAELEAERDEALARLREMEARISELEVRLSAGRFAGIGSLIREVLRPARPDQARRPDRHPGDRSRPAGTGETPAGPSR